MGQAMPKAGFHCPICNADFATFVDFDSEQHACCLYMTKHPGIAEKIISARIDNRERERRAAARYVALFRSPDVTRH